MYIKKAAFRLPLIHNCKHVSRILWSARRRTVIIYLAVALLQQSCCLPFPLFRKSGNINEQLIMPCDIPGFTWHCSTQGLPLITITCNYRELLPHVFTLIRQTADGNFLWHYLPGSLIIAAPGPAINRCVALYCPDFPFVRKIKRTITRLQHLRIYDFKTPFPIRKANTESRFQWRQNQIFHDIDWQKFLLLFLSSVFRVFHF